MYFINPRIKNLHRIFDQNERKDYLRLDLNENPGGLPQDFISKVLSDVTPQFVSQYPETLEFTEKLAEFLGTDISHLCIVNGSAEGIRYIIQAFTSENGRIVGVVPSYFMFQIYSEMYGREFVKVPYNEDLTMDVENIIDTLTDDTQLLILLNPNNPMGNVYSDDPAVPMYRFSGSNDLNDVAVWANGTARLHVEDVGQHNPNQLGIYDMSGNAQEMTSSWYVNYSAVYKEVSMPSNKLLVIRGGRAQRGVQSTFQNCSRDAYAITGPVSYSNYIGFRFACDPIDED